MIDKMESVVPFEQAFELVETTVSKYINKKGLFLEALITEGLFSKNLMHKDDGSYKEYIYFTYERFCDHLSCQYLLKESKDISSDLQKGGRIFNYLSHNGILTYQGIIEALAIQIPEIFGKEIYELLPEPDNHLIKDAFISSLLWRKIVSINENCFEYLNKYIISEQNYFDDFLETIISTTTIEDHYFNAFFLHKYLMKFSLSDRDAIWTYFLRYRFSDDTSIKRLVDWGWDNDDKSHISDETIKLASITLSWFLSSTDRELRDASTKALICLLKDRILVLIDILELFVNVNDPYIYERLFAVAYGSTLLTNQREKLLDLSEYVYSVIFKDKLEVYPHILLRDYARNICEYSTHLGIKLSFDIQKVRPPYKSSLKIKDISREEIENKYTTEYRSGTHSIIFSMGTERGKHARPYGDFGRYVFQSAFSDWDVDPSILSNMAIELIFNKYGYSEEKHGNYDTGLPYNGRQQNRIERIGKKYQWMAMHELLARVSDNLPKVNKWNDEEILQPYQGTWEPFVRDIDPSIVNKEIHVTSNSNKMEWNFYDPKWDFYIPDNEWLSKTTELINYNNLFMVEDRNDNKWFVLEAYPQWVEPKKLGEKLWSRKHKMVWTQIRSYLCHKNDFVRIIAWAKKQNYHGRWMPETTDKYTIFSREYYWSPAYIYCYGRRRHG